MMTIQHFNALSEHKQLRDLILNGVCIAERKLKDKEALLFQLHSFYVEVHFSSENYEIQFSRTFADTEELYPYLEGIKLEGLF